MRRRVHIMGRRMSGSCAVCLPNVRAGGEGVSMINPGVLVTYVRTTCQPVGLRCYVRISVACAPFVSGTETPWLRFCLSALTRDLTPPAEM